VHDFTTSFSSRRAASPYPRGLPCPVLLYLFHSCLASFPFIISFFYFESFRYFPLSRARSSAWTQRHAVRHPPISSVRHSFLPRDVPSFPSIHRSFFPSPHPSLPPSLPSLPPAIQTTQSPFRILLSPPPPLWYHHHHHCHLTLPPT
jgi:hypothetical protein